ncbi:hypothetical protein ACIRRT_24040 [Streptomyces sp. NPDC102256]|uniref:hypothetical protein n=1 Tax=unclassified Streptomyces TaxID=2593676 RepID=UPI002B1CF8EA|nr:MULTISPECIES: hypothetical protein [unclassified Streptomyces]
MKKFGINSNKKDESGITVPPPEKAGPEPEVEERAPDKPTELPKQAWGKVLSGSLREFKKDEQGLRCRAARIRSTSGPLVLPGGAVV